MKFSDRLAEIMKVHGESNYKLAKDIECSQSSVGNWLRGVMPTKVMLKTIATHYGMTLEQLMRGVD